MSACPRRTARLQRLLLAWYATKARPLPWRETCDPYAILVSELMLQQTQVARVEAAYRAFLERFPTVDALAAAPTAAVLRAWRGLGYNRRAVALHRAARVIVDRHRGQVPAQMDALRALPGVGDYTARAVQAFAFRTSTAPVDTNVARVLARAVAARPLTRAECQGLADALVPVDGARNWAQALMDLGARYCTARSPRCGSCPVAAACAWRLEDPGRRQDPAAAGAMRSKPKGAFVGSDRFHRGRLVEALRRGPLAPAEVAASAQLADARRLAGIVDGLLADGLAEWHDGRLRLPADGDV